jgi:UDP-N-acetylmuramoyl-L-alanyl-D-glutamate--2,6-diaminopimelate ligase
MGLLLANVLDALDGSVAAGDAAVEVSAVTHDSRLAGPDSVFVAVGGLKLDGAAFAADAVDRGAVAVVSASEPPGEWGARAAWIRVPDARLALSALADAVHDHPTAELEVVGVTGTNGKTTTAYMLAAGLEAAGASAAMVGTIETRVCGRSERSRLTTPEAPFIHGLAAEHLSCGGRAMVLEVSSHALKLRRADHLDLDAAVFTNLTQDHLDFHESWEDYLASKRRLFSELLAADRVAVVNVDDPAGTRVLEGCRARALTYSLDPDSEADIAPASRAGGIDGFEASLRTPWGRLRARSRLVGDVNLLNLMAALGAGAALGHDPERLLEGIATLESVPGRLEAIAGRGGRRVFVDYSHTPDAVRAACEVLRPLTRGRLWVVVGCGGDRDRDKRSKMGRAAAEGGDVVVITSDNPRSEDPADIIEMIRPGVEQAGCVRAGGSIDGSGRYAVRPDRREAIRLALASSGEDDSILVAGKGHEDYQIFRDRTIHFSDQEVVREVLADLDLEPESADAL